MVLAGAVHSRVTVVVDVVGAEGHPAEVAQTVAQLVVVEAGKVEGEGEVGGFVVDEEVLVVLVEVVAVGLDELGVEEVAAAGGQLGPVGQAQPVVTAEVAEPVTEGAGRGNGCC